MHLCSNSAAISKSSQVVSHRFLKVSTDLQKRFSIVLLKSREAGASRFVVQSAPLRAALLPLPSESYRSASSFRSYPAALEWFNKLTKEAQEPLGTMVTTKVPLHLSVPMEAPGQALCA